MLKLSIIVPVYNVRPYLWKCVESLCNQDLAPHEYEIILVDDGSTDGSGELCEEYVKAYPQPLPEGKGDSFASVWGAHTADSTQYNLLKENAQENRKNPTEAEAVLWDMLKGNNIGLHFRRQHIILDYIVDFICLEKGLVIELDGGYHNDPEQVEYDKQRTAHLAKLGYTELRFTNEELLTNPDSVIAQIKSVASSLPSLQGRGGVRPLIRVIHQKNAGLSVARNAGLAVAKGKYVQCVDSDDYLEPNVLGGLIAQCERENLDVLRFDYQNVRTIDAARLEYEAFEPNKYPHRVDRRTDVVDGETYLNERMGYACYAVMFVVRRELIFNSLTHSFINSFTEGIHFEDVDWTPRMLLAAKRVNATQTVVYNYLVREGSITKTGTDVAKKRKNIEDSMFVAEQMGELYRQYQQCQWLRNMQSSMACGVLTNVVRDFYNERKDYIRRLKAMGAFPLMIADQGKTYRRRAKLVNIFGVELYCLMVRCLLKR